MLLDWVTARVSIADLNPAARAACELIGDRITRFCPRTGHVHYTTPAWDSVRSDSHQIAIKAGSDLWMQGSPARCIGRGDAVFGAGASAELDLVGCVDRMAQFVAGSLGVDLPGADSWIVTTVDVTANMRLGSLAEVRQALHVLRDCEGGRYRVSNKGGAGDSVYWGSKSRLRKGKAYAKGPHLRHLAAKPDFNGLRYTADEINLADRLLRLELRLGREYWKRNDWREATPETLTREWEDYFLRMVGDADMTTDADLMKRVIEVAPTEGQGKSAYLCWNTIQSEGWERARDLFPSRTWYRHLRILRSAGLGDADISRGQIVSLRRKVLTLEMVNSWSQIAA